MTRNLHAATGSSTDFCRHGPDAGNPKLTHPSRRALPPVTPRRPAAARSSRVVAWSTRLAAATLGSLALPLPAATLLSTNFPASPPPSFAGPETGLSVLRLFGALAIVLALFLAGVWIFRNWHRVGQSRGLHQLRILESRSLGGRHALHVVGYQGQRLLLASSPQGVSLISHLPAAAEEPAVDPPKAGPATDPIGANFVRVLQQAIQQKS